MLKQVLKRIISSYIVDYSKTFTSIKYILIYTFSLYKGYKSDSQNSNKVFHGIDAPSRNLKLDANTKSNDIAIFLHLLDSKSIFWVQLSRFFWIQLCHISLRNNEKYSTSVKCHFGYKLWIQTSEEVTTAFNIQLTLDLRNFTMLRPISKDSLSLSLLLTSHHIWLHIWFYILRWLLWKEKVSICTARQFRFGSVLVRCTKSYRNRNSKNFWDET